METGVVLGLAATLTVPIVLLIGKLARLRDTTYENWQTRVDLADGNLTERAIAILRRLQTEADTLLGDERVFDPTQALVDPKPLARLSSNFVKTLRVRDKLGRRFKTQLRICDWAVSLAVLWTVGVWVSALQLLKAVDFRWLPEISVGLSGLALFTSFILVMIYFYLDRKLTDAHWMGQPEGAATKRRKRK